MRQTKLLFSGPRSTLAIWPKRMIVSPRVATTSCANSSGFSSEVCALMFFWVNSAFTSPAAVVKLLAANALRTSSGVMPSEAILSGSSHTRMAKVEPPRISADATPLIACSLRPDHAVEVIADLRRRHLLALEADVHQRKASARRALHHRIVRRFRKHALDLVHLRQHVGKRAVAIGIKAKLESDRRNVLRRA